MREIKRNVRRRKDTLLKGKERIVIVMKIKDRKVWNSMVTQLMKPDRLEEVHETLAKFIRHTCEESLFSLQSERKNLKNQL